MDNREPRTERAVLAALVREDREAEWRASELVDELAARHSPAAVHRAMRQLVEVGVAYRSRPFVWITPATRCLRDLGVIALRKRG
jgi:hypothetical protein